MSIIVVAAYCQPLPADDLTHIAGSFCALKLPAQYTICVALFSLPSCGNRKEIGGDYLPPGPLVAPPAGLALAGSSDPPLAVLVWVDLAVGPTTGLESEAAWLQTTTLDWLSALVLVVRTLTSSSLS
jgi:hypothetical protein